MATIVSLCTRGRDNDTLGTVRTDIVGQLRISNELNTDFLLNVWVLSEIRFTIGRIHLVYIYTMQYDQISAKTKHTSTCVDIPETLIRIVYYQ